MKTLNLHVDYIEWEGLKKALKNIKDFPSQDLSKKRVEEALVVLTAVEKNDSLQMLKDYVKSIIDISEKINTKTVVLYPYAHLSKELGKPSVALKIFENAEKKLEEKGFKVFRAPFGYYKSFELKVKGHPLSELSREIVSNKEVEEDLTESERINLLREISKSTLDTSKLKENDHRIIGKKMDLWSMNPVAPGMVFWHDRGLHIRNKLIDYWREIHRKAGYQEVSTPQIMDKKLWEVSGHWSKYKENNFRTIYEGRDFLVKPMNCPGGMLIYKVQQKTHKDLPVRFAEMGLVHRVELSGVLSGLFRAIQFTQDDAHIFCTEDQLEQEIKSVINLISFTLKVFDLRLDHVELSTRPENRIGSDEVWDRAERALEKVLKNTKMDYQINEGEGAFYGPKIDFHLKDSLGRTWQCSTIQLDMALPERFDLTYLDEEGNRKRPIVIHRVIYGSLERFIGIITENYNGKFPLWISPNQVKVLTANEEVKEYAKEIFDALFKEGFRVELDDRAETISKKVREAIIERFNYLVTVGEKEMKDGLLAVRKSKESKIAKIGLNELIASLKKEIREKK